MTRFLTFLTSLINPALIYRIDRVTDTVTFTTVAAGVPMGMLVTQDFVFADEATALSALDDFVADVRAYTLEDSIAAVSAGLLANRDIVRRSLSNTNLGDIDARTIKLAKGVVDAAEKIVAEYESL